MLFNSFAFIVFFPIFFFFYFITRRDIRLYVCLLSSYIFYGWWDWRFLSIIIIVTLVNFFAGLKIFNSSNKTFRRYTLISVVFINLSILAYFKYFNFFSKSFSELLYLAGMTPSLSTLNIVLPVGISFYIFQALSYVFDVYRNRMNCESSILRFATFVSLFPQLVAGPIVRANLLLEQLRTDQIFSTKKFFEGIKIVLYGYFIKIAIADSIAPVVDRLYADPEKETALILLIGAFLFSFQIYCDFHGYSLIAIGLGKMMGFEFGVNFNKPYLSKNFSEFWQRWHISLSSWLRDYLYIPLGGNRKGKIRTCINLLITMLLGGLWHGANWTFVIWGLIHGIYLIVQNIFQAFALRIRILNISLKWISPFFVFSLTSFAWIFFRSPDLDISLKIIKKILSLDNFNLYYVPEKFLVLKCFLLILMLMVFELIDSFNENILNNDLVKIASIPLVFWGLSLLGNFTGNSFIYFQF